MSAITFRSATTEDIPALQRLITASIRSIATDEYTAFQREEWLRVYVEPAVLEAKIAEAAGSFVLAFLEGELVGSGILTDTEIHGMYVDPRRQGRGIGAAIVAHLEEIARSRGARSVHLDSSLPARPFYLKIGFADADPMTFDMDGTPVPGMRMMKEL